MTHGILWHGDSSVECKKLKPDTIQSVITDPPFGVDNQSNMAKTAEGKAYARKIANDESPEKAIEIFTAVTEAFMPAMKAESDIYIFTSYQVVEEWLTFTRELLEPHGFKRKAVLVWQKDGPGMGDLKSWGMGCEFILYYKRGGRAMTSPRRNNVLAVPQLRPNQLIHPHEKPAPLLNLLIEHSTSRGDWILDPFAGSGSLVRAAKALGRNSIGVEYDEENYNLANKALTEIASAGMDFGDY